MKCEILISCEHAVADIPPDFLDDFRSSEAKRALYSHRGFDEGALDVAIFLRESLSIKRRDCFHAGTASRLLIDLNRSETNRALFSDFTRGLPSPAKSRLIAEYHRPYRAGIIEALKSRIAAGKTVMHLSVHSFTPVLNGKVRRPDIALLYDPRRKTEKAFADLWITTLKQEATDRGLPVQIGRNDPYRGTADGCTTAIRRLFSPDRYIGFEIEINQRLLTQIQGEEKGARVFPDEIKELLLRSLLLTMNR